MIEAWTEFRRLTDPLAAWLDEHVVEGADARVRQLDLREALSFAVRRQS